MILYTFKYLEIEIGVGKESAPGYPDRYFANSEQTYTVEGDTELEVVTQVLEDVKSEVEHYYGSVPEYFIALQREKELAANPPALPDVEF